MATNKSNKTSLKDSADALLGKSPYKANTRKNADPAKPPPAVFTKGSKYYDFTSLGKGFDALAFAPDKATQDKQALDEELANKAELRRLDKDFIDKVFGVRIKGLDDYYAAQEAAVEIMRLQASEQKDISLEQLTEDYIRNVNEFKTDLNLAQTKLNLQYERAGADVKRQHAQTVQNLNINLQGALEARSRAERATAAQSSSQLSQAGLADSGIAEILTPHYDRLFGQAKRQTALDAQSRGIGTATEARDTALQRQAEDLRTAQSDLSLQGQRQLATLNRDKNRRQEDLLSQDYYAQLEFGNTEDRLASEKRGAAYDAQIDRLSGQLDLATDAGDLQAVKRRQDQIIGLGSRPTYHPTATPTYRAVVQSTDRQLENDKGRQSNTATANEGY